MKPENASAGIVGIVSVIALAVVLMLTGCASTKYGDGKVGPVPLNATVEAFANAADSRVPGSGAKIREWYAQSAVSRVPDGYVIQWDAFYDGRQIDASKIITVPRLAPMAESSVIVVGKPPTNPAPTVDAELEDVLNNL